MKRLTSSKPVSDMSMIELAHNSCYADTDRNARYRDYEVDVDAREMTKKIARDMVGLDLNNISDEDFDECIHEALADGTDSLIGLIALFYRNLWAMANLRERLKYYEDLEEEGKLLKLPFKVGDTVYDITEGFIEPCTVEAIFLDDYVDKNGNKTFIAQTHYDREDRPYTLDEIYFTDVGRTIFITKLEAEAKMKEMGMEDV